MPDTSQPNQNSGELDSRVGTLLQEALDAATRVDQGLEGSVDGRSDVGAVPASEAPSTTRAPSQAPPLSQATEAPPLDDIGQLDDDLAKLTESLLSGEMVSPVAGTPPATPPVTTTNVESPSPARAEATSPPEPPARIASETTVPVAHGPTPSTKIEAPPSSATPVAADPGAEPAPGARSVTGAAAQGSVASSLDIAPRRVLAKAAERVAPIALSGLATVSAPVLSKPRVLRDTIGWLAVWTLFLAGCVWVYLLFVHKPPAPESSKSPVNLVTEERLEHAPEEPSPARAGGESHEPAPAEHAGGGDGGHH